MAFLDLDWKERLRQGGSLSFVPLDSGINGWASPPGDQFLVRGLNYFTKKQKIAAGDCLLKPLGVDWLKSHSKLDHVLSLRDNRVMQALHEAQTEGHCLKAFVFAVNLQVPGRDHHSAIFYYVTEDIIPQGSLFYRFIYEDDAFRNSRFKLINKIVRGPWIVRATVGNYAACLLGKALTCNYLKGSNYLEIDVDIGSSALASAICHLALGCVNLVTVDMAFLIESQADEELPERILGAVRVAQIEMGSAVYADGHGEAPGVSQSPGNESSWRKFSRGLSKYGGKPSKIEAEQDKLTEDDDLGTSGPLPN